MKKLLLCSSVFGIFIASSGVSYGQVFYSEGFDGALTWTLNTDIGVEGASPNPWFISCNEEGVGVAACGTTCGAGNKTLHVGSTLAGDVGAAYGETGAGITDTDRRAESGDINTVGKVGLTLDFEMIGFGTVGSDFCELFYSADGGAIWNSLDPALGSTCCLGPCSGVDQGLWQTNTYPLPVACEGIPNLRISFVWKNIDDGVAADPSFAVDSITISETLAPSVFADFIISDVTICPGDCPLINDNSTGAITTWTWTFTDASIPTFVGAAIGSACFYTPGSWDITLTVTDGVTVDDTTVTVTVFTPTLPTIIANPNDSICLGDPITLSGGGCVSYVWSGGVTDGLPFTPPVAGSTIYTVTGTDANGCDTFATVTVLVEDCGPLIAGFSYPDPICKGMCITLTDTTVGVPNQWDWDFDGAVSPTTSTDQNPFICFDSVGVFDIQLSVEDAFGQTSSVTNQITVFDSPQVWGYLDTLIDLGGTANLIAVDSTTMPLTFLWTPGYYLDCDTCQISTAHPQHDTMYVITVTDTNGCKASDTVWVTVNFIEGVGVPSAFSPNGDGTNDILWVKGIGLRNIEFSVYNYYGQLLFTTQDQSIGWDGKFHDKDENPGVFLWTLSYTFDNGHNGSQKGNTTLIR